MAESTLLSNRSARWILYTFALFGFYNTWGRSAIDGTLALLFRALHGSETYSFPGTNSVLKTTITGIRWPIDYLLNVLIVFFWQAVDGSYPSTSVIGIYFLGQYFSILTSFYINSWRSDNKARWSLAPLPWLLAFQMLGAAVVGPWYALLYLSRSPLVSEPASWHQALGFLAPPTAIMLLPATLAIGYVLPAVLMALPSPLTVSNGFQQMAVMTWNLFPIILSLVQITLNTSSSILGLAPVAKTSPSEQHLSAVRIAYFCGLIVSAASHIAVVSVSATTVIFPFLHQAEYVQTFSPKALVLPPISWTPVSCLGEGVRSFLLWDQVFTYGTMLFLALLQLARVAPIPVEKFGILRLIILMSGIIVVAGPGSACVLLNWAADESLIHHDSAMTHSKVDANASNKEVVT